MHGRELWTSDGTPGGTAQVLDLRSGSASSMPDAPYMTGLTAAVGSTFFFVADDGVAGVELWKSDGTAAGTVLVKDIRPGPGGSEPRWLTAAGGRLFFTADDGASGGHGRELWVSDGTAAGTVLLDLVPGAVSSLPRELYRVGRGIVFSAFDPAHGVEPWVSDGTPAGTHLLDDVAPGPLPSSPSQFRLAGPYLFFTANDGTTGFEPWWVYQNEAPAYLDFFTVTPCRLVDTRSTSALAAGVPRTFPLTGSCGIPAGARAVAANVTVTGPTGDGFLTLWPSGTPFPGTSTVNVKTGITRAGNAVVTLHGGAVDAQATLGAGGSVQVVIDVSGYFQ